MPDNPEIYDRTKVSMSSEAFSKMMSALHEDNIFYKIFTANSCVYAQIPDEEQGAVEGLIEEIKKYETNQEYSDIIFMNCYLKLLVYLHQYTDERVQAPSGVVVRAIEYINSHLTENITIDEISEAVHMSKYHFCRRFKDETGFTVMEYILKTRLAAAKNMLKETEYLISDISEQCGFSSVSYFSRVFKENTGKSAFNYRKEYRT